MSRSAHFASDSNLIYFIFIQINNIMVVCWNCVFVFVPWYVRYFLLPWFKWNFSWLPPRFCCKMYVIIHAVFFFSSFPHINCIIYLRGCALAVRQKPNWDTFSHVSWCMRAISAFAVFENWLRTLVLLIDLFSMQWKFSKKFDIAV